MGNFVSTLDTTNNTVTKIQFGENTDDKKTQLLNELKDCYNQYGFNKFSISTDNLQNLFMSYWTKLKFDTLSDAELESLAQGLSKNKPTYDEKTKVYVISISTGIIGLLSMHGIYSIIDPIFFKLDNKKPDEKEILKLKQIEIIVPNIIFTENCNKYFVLHNKITTLAPGSNDLLIKMLESINTKFKYSIIDNQIVLFNMINVLFNVGIYYVLENYIKQKLPYRIISDKDVQTFMIEQIATFITQLPHDKCYSQNDLIKSQICEQATKNLITPQLQTQIIIETEKTKQEIEKTLQIKLDIERLSLEIQKLQFK